VAGRNSGGQLSTFLAQAASGQSSSGQNSTDQLPASQNSGGQNPPDQPPPGQNSRGQNSSDKNSNGQAPAPQNSGEQVAANPDSGGQPPPQNQPQAQQIQDEIDTVENRNTPVISTGSFAAGRVGDPGFDRLITSDSLLGTAFAASNRVRFGIEAHGVYLFSGTPDGSSTLRFGTLPGKTAFGEQSAAGYAGVAQLSTETFGMAVGTTPQGFPVHNVTAGIRFRPFDKWFTFLGVRDSVKDSLLSYAGTRDPATGITWGGVVANTGTLQFESGSTNKMQYRAINSYASASYSFLQGKKVPDNWDVAANAGVYWHMVRGLTMGVNVTGMHYDKNLNFFSFGQGGYFSPQQYYLGSIPISWYSRHRRFEYEIKASGGVQYLQQDASPFYPTPAGSTILTPGFYASNTSTAPNYNVDLRLGYRVAPHVYFDTFATANNTRDYYTQSVGFNLRFMIDRIPTSTDLHVNSIPDWMGRQPFAIR
jgi:hypothetical protein